MQLPAKVVTAADKVGWRIFVGRSDFQNGLLCAALSSFWNAGNFNSISESIFMMLV